MLKEICAHEHGMARASPYPQSCLWAIRPDHKQSCTGSATDLKNTCNLTQCLRMNVNV